MIHAGQGVRDALAGEIAAGGDDRFAETNQDCRLNQSTVFEAGISRQSCRGRAAA
jgi:hypothetical protein